MNLAKFNELIVCVCLEESMEEEEGSRCTPPTP